MNQYSQTQISQALLKCETEALQHINQIQDHGVLLVLSNEQDFPIVQASANLGNLFNCSAEKLIGQPLSNLIGEMGLVQFELLTKNCPQQQANSGIIKLTLTNLAPQIQARVFESSGFWILELIELQDIQHEEQLQNLLALIQQKLNTNQAQNLADYFAHIAQLIQNLTGYDSVKIYEFDQNWDGEIIAEHKHPSFSESYLGLHFPASDIPAQARTLYTINPYRQVADIDAAGIPILPELNPISLTPVDLSLSVLRNLSSVHIEYLRNMQVKASLSVSILHNGKLWGLIVCHHKQAKLSSYAMQEALNLISRMIALKLSAHEAQAQRFLINKSVSIVGELLKNIGLESDKIILERLLPDLMHLPDANGIIIVIEGKIYPYGITPDLAEITELINWLKQLPAAENYCTDHLQAAYPAASAYTHFCAGILVTPLSASLHNCIIWCRPEKERTINWAGSTEKHISTNSQGELLLSPRKSFKSWTENWRGYSDIWSTLQQGVATMLAVMVTDTLSHKFQLQQAMLNKEQADAELRIAATAFETQEGIMLIDANHQIIRVNHAFVKLTGYGTEELLGQHPYVLKSEQHEPWLYDNIWEKIRTNPAWEDDVWIKTKQQHVFPAHLTLTAVQNPNGDIKNYVGTLKDITHNRAAAAEIERLAYYDPLTGLPNRRLLINRLKQSLATSQRHNKLGAILFIDLDNFKNLNDTLGHDMGDLLLKRVAERLCNCVREVDTVARLGGDEFVILLENLNELAIQAGADTESIALKILHSVSQPYQLDGHDYITTPSIGGVIFSDQLVESEDLLKQADIAMYQAKKAGRNTFCFFDPQMQANISARATLENDLRFAIHNDQLKLYYQIQTSLDHGHLGAEVLVRWQHPSRGLVPPNDFIPLAEETGLILEIGQLVLEKACQQLQKWRDNQQTAKLTLAVNVSAKQFHAHNFVEKVKETIIQYHVSPGQIKLELTESILLRDIDSIIAKMNVLRDFGLTFSLDDFGTGYSSLQYLKRLPLDQLKIDQSFVRDLVEDESDQAIVRTIIGMAKALELNVIAEGVENEAQRTILEQHGCHDYQGYLFSRPLPIDDFHRFLLN